MSHINTQAPPLGERVRAHCQSRGISLSRFGRMVARDPKLAFDLVHRGRTPRPALTARIEAALTMEAAHG